MPVKSNSSKLPRAAGVLLHPTSLHTNYEIGDLGKASYEFVDFLCQGGQAFWQMLPIGPTGYLDSPYQCFSAFAGNFLLISPDSLIENGFLLKSEASKIIDQYYSRKQEIQTSTTKVRINYEKSLRFKQNMVEKAFSNYLTQKSTKFAKENHRFEAFCKKEKYWLEDFALFMSIKKANDLHSWITWPKEFKIRDESTISQWKKDHQQELTFYCFIQWIFDQQWKDLKKYANKKGISIIGDMPIFVAHDSADVWANQQYFTLKPDGNLKYQAGVPPDYFSESGQLWGNPLYRWNILEKKGFNWFILRLKKLLEFVDWIRIDHFRGFEAFWQVKGDAKNAIKGNWIKAPGENLFRQIKSFLGEIPVIAENLGVITKEVEDLRNKYHFPGMGVLQFAFSSNAKNNHLPHNYEKNTIVYTGTHDNDTTLGWWKNEATAKEQKMIKQYLNTDADDICQDLIKSGYRSIAQLVIIPIQDYLAQDSNFRMNTPSVPDGNWQYLVPDQALTSELAEEMRKLTKIFGRNSIL